MPIQILEMSSWEKWLVKEKKSSELGPGSTKTEKDIHSCVAYKNGTVYSSDQILEHIVQVPFQRNSSFGSRGI